MRLDRTIPDDVAALLASLTPREREVLELVPLGLSNAEIARHLFISDGTVRKHLENAFLKLGVHSRTQAAAVLNAARVPPLMPVVQEQPKDLPRYLTSFIGRQRELGQMRDLLSGTRLLTLTGPGGVGKTRLALRGAQELADLHDADAWFVDFGGLAEPSLVAHAVASALGLHEQAGYRALDTVIHYLRTKRVLLLLDNCEHLLAACADLADGLLRACPSLRILATSRQALRIDGETAYPVPSLSVPKGDRLPPVEQLMEWEAVHLLVERARAGQPEFEPSGRNASLLVQICRRLDGIPLAIELAAALVRTRPLELIAAGLDDRFRLLSGGSRTAVPRQQTLRATVDWSHDLLTKAERVLLRRLSVFAGSFSAEAAAAVCAGDYGDAAAVDLLANLVDKSLVVLDSGAEGGGHRLLETVRDYGGQRLIESGEEQKLRTRHCDWYLALTERAQQHLFGGPHQSDWLALLDREHDNLRAALEWSRLQPHLRDGWLRLASGLWRFWEIRGYLTEGRTWLEPALARTRGEVSEVRANALTGAGILAFMQGDYEASFALHEESLAIHRQLGGLASIVYALSNLGSVAVELGDYKRAWAFEEEAAQLSRMLGRQRESAILSLHLAEILDRQGDEVGARYLFETTLTTLEELADGNDPVAERAFARWAMASGLSMYASTVLKHDDLTLARELALRALFLYRDLGDGREGARVLTLLADVANAQGDADAAVSLLLEALTTRHGMGDRPGIAGILERLAMVALPIDATRAARLLGAAEALREQMGTPLPAREHVRHRHLQVSLDGALGIRRYVVEHQTGRLLTLAQAVEDASAITGQPVTRPL